MSIPAKKRRGTEAAPEALGSSSQSRFIPTPLTTLPPGTQSATALVAVRVGVGAAPDSGSAAPDAEQVAAKILRDVCVDLAATNAFGSHDGWLAVSLFTSTPLVGEYFRPLRALVSKVMAALDKVPIEATDTLDSFSHQNAVGVHAEWLFRPDATPSPPSPTFLAQLTWNAFACSHHRVERKIPAKDGRNPGPGEQPSLPPRPADELVGCLVSAVDETERLAAAQSLAYLATVGELPSAAVVRIAEVLPSLSVPVAVLLCPLFGMVLGETSVPAENFRHDVASKIGGLLFASSDELRLSVRAVFATWQAIDPFVRAQFEGLAHASGKHSSQDAGATSGLQPSFAPTPGTEELTVQELQEKMRTAINQAGLTQQTVGERMGHPIKRARLNVQKLLTSSDPSLLHVNRFARACGITLADLLSL